jgi:plastocyanin
VVRKLPVLIAVAAALSFGVAACGDDEDSDSAATTSAATTTETATADDTGGAGGAGEAVKVVETDYEIDPSEPTVPAGTVTFEIVNDGEAPHNIEIEGNGVEEVSDTFNAGDSGELTVELEPGTYDFYCAIDGHKDLGMDGELTVE